MSGELSMIFDLETNGLKPSVIHCMAVYCVEAKEKLIFADQPGYLPLRTGFDLLMEASWLIAHNGDEYDVPVIRNLYPEYSFENIHVLDTLKLARCYFPDILQSDVNDSRVPSALHGKQSLEAWGYRLGVPKGSFGKTTDWQRFTPQMAAYCLTDIEVTLALYELLELAALEENGAEQTQADHQHAAVA